MVTGQYYDSRVIKGRHARDAALEFIQLATTYADLSDDSLNIVYDVEECVMISMANWPDDVPFGAWFDQWADRWNITVED